MEVISVNNIKKSFKKFEVLKGISFSVKEGEVLSIIGPSGSGKSTLLRCITQLETVTDGTISICGQTLVKDSVYASKEECLNIGLKVGLVFQNFNLFPHMSVLENITCAQINVLNKSKEEAVEVARELLKKMNLSDKENSYPCELSGGQQQRVAIARALANEPAILLADEPTGNLDPKTAEGVFQTLLSLVKEKNLSALIATHNPDLALQMDRQIKVENGMIKEGL